MKLTAILLTIALLQVHAKSFPQVTLSLKNAPMEKVFFEIERQAGFGFLYTKNIISHLPKVTIQVKNATVNEVLNECFKGQPIEYSIENNMIVVKRKVAAIVTQVTDPELVPPVQISGRVATQTGEPLPDVSVIIVGSKTGTTTNSEGRFTITAPDNKNIVLEFSSVGYLTKRVNAGNQTEVNVVLELDVTGLDDIVVVGYGTQKKVNLTGSIASISSEDLKNIPVATTGQMLQGKLAGVRITQPSGVPGSDMKFQIRGAISLTAGSNPLYVIDGMPIPGSISFLNPDEIENITVLKDASSASLYGSRASNGVILINTKSGKAGRVQVHLNAYNGIQQIPKNRRLKMMNATQYAQFQKEIAESNGRTVNDAFQNPEQYGKGTDWFDVITRTAPIQNYSLSINGGTEKLRTSATVGYFNQEGVVVNTGFNRISLRLNTAYNPIDNLTIGFNIAPTQTFNTNFNTDGNPYGTENIIPSALITTPLASPYNADGSLALTATDPASFGNPNWLRVAKEKVYKGKNFQLLSNAFIQYKVIKGLTAKSALSVQMNNNSLFQFNPSTIGTLFSPPPHIPSGSDYNYQSYNWLNENTLQYEKRIDDHNFDALIGFTSQHFKGEGDYIGASNYPDDLIQTVNAARQTFGSTDIQEWALLSFIARINYSFKNKYLFTASFRRDGSSRFGLNNRWGNFPSLSAGWVVSQEDFWTITPVSFFKLRASYGITGNFEIGNYTHTSAIGSVFYPFGNTPFSGRVPTNLGNQNLGWENNKQFNVGTDINIFNNRIQVTYDFYNKNTTELLFNVGVPSSSGFTNIQNNIGELKFWGHEISINGSVIKTDRLSWNSNFNMSFDRNRTLALATNSGILSTGMDLGYGFQTHRTEVGMPISQFYGSIWDGVYMNQADFDKSPKNEASQVGTIKFQDLNGDGIISFPEDMTYIGNPWPKYTYGMTNTFNYRGFDLSFSIAGSYGNKVLAFYENWATNLDGVFNVLEEVQHRWKSEADPGDGKYGSVQQGTTFLERDRWNSRYLKDGSYLALKNVMFGYDFLSKRNKYNAHLYLSLQNVFILTKYPSGNPEVNTLNSTSGITPGIDGNSYPVPRTITLGINLSLK